MSKNLWPDFETKKGPRSPKSVIEEAGAGLQEKTKGFVIFYPLSTSIISDQVDASFSLYARSLSYHFPFLRARFPLQGLYPVTLTAYKMADVVANDENELIASLGKIFSAPSTVETIQNLMSLAQPAGAP
jgi:hypothetical protein